ncbi:MAG: trypsin-like peptidase domain-containing protein [Rikenellaceae bacterium]
MNKKVILWSIFASILAGGVSAYAVTESLSSQSESHSDNFTELDPRGLSYQHTQGTSNTEHASSDVHFASISQGASLPDFTSAAQRGVEAVVYVETMQQYSGRSQSSRGGGSFDPFEFFFGPSYRGGSGSSSGEQQREEELRKSGGGSGVLISADGYIVTNNHVISSADKINVTLNSGDTFEATLIGSDPSTDIALLKIESPTPLSYLSFGDSERLKVGEWVLAVGNPFGLNSTVTAGIVSAKGRSLGANTQSKMGIESFIQTDAAVNPGNSGGALMTIDGSLVGINTLIKSPTGSFTGYSFAVPSTIAKKIVTDIREFGVVQRALLGISMQEISDEWIAKFGSDYGITSREGVFIAEVVEGGAAQSVGIAKGEVLLAINDQSVSTPSEVQKIITEYRPGDKIKISTKSKGKVKHFDVTLRNTSGREELLSATEVSISKQLGATFVTPSEKTLEALNLRGGIQVESLEKDGLLSKSKVKVGFVITSINDISVRSESDLRKIKDEITSIGGVYPSGQRVEYRTL